MGQDDGSLPEITIKGTILGLVLSVVLAAANAYLGLFAGMTVSASIPAAVISMGLLRFFRHNNILENNIVQTAASAGEALAAGCIFTLPALIILGSWGRFDYLSTTVIAVTGGILGVLFTIPLRRSLIIQSTLRFPEGIAAAEVLKAGQMGGQGLQRIIRSGLVGGLFKLGSELIGFWPTEIMATATIGRTVTAFGMALSPALLAVGLIVGLNIAGLMLAGGIVNWLIAIPIYSWLQQVPEGLEPAQWATQIWAQKTRYIGVGAMLAGGLWTILTMRKMIISGIRSGIEAYRTNPATTRSGHDRTEMDIPMTWILILIGLSVLPLFVIYQSFTGRFWVSAATAMVTIIAGFAFSAVAGYMAGLVGSSNNPISGVTITTIVFCSFFLMALLGRSDRLGPTAAIITGATVCCAAAIAGDNLQDLKTGQLVRATPWKQQVMQIAGTFVGALVIAPVLTLLYKAYGFAGQPSPATRPLPAPQANVMASVAKGIFQTGLPWTFIWIGVGLAILLIVIDTILQRRNSPFRTPVLAVAIGIYLPLTISVATFVGGLLNALMRMSRDRLGRHILSASGLITGEALVGIVIAIPVVLLKARGMELPLTQTWHDLAPNFLPGVLALINEYGTWLGTAVFAGVCIWSASQSRG